MFQQAASLSSEFSARSLSEERRATVRYPSTVAASYRAISDQSGVWFHGRVRDLSTLGVGLILQHQLEPGKLVEIRLEALRRSVLRTIQGRVVHVEPEAAGGWGIGCAFTSELDAAGLRLFQAERVRTAGADSRRWVRFPCDVETVCWTCATTPGERTPARVLNISAGGIGLLLPCQFDAGTLLYFDLPRATGQPGRRVLVRVVRLMEHANGDWFLGCEFADRLTEAELAALR